ncbi:Translation initiation factor, beta propellor-like domain [Sesbania bispinosa]|nr:Translation initiation factor, beta propellor-like domain [Sesbania bispinosa]
MADVMVMREIEDKASLLGIDLSTLDLDAIRLPPGDDCGIASDDEDIYQEDNLEFDSGFANIIVVDNLPVVPREKFEKLEGVVRKIYSQIGVIKEDGLWMPIDPETEKTLGYCFIEYNTPQEAELAKEKTHGYKLDRAHIFSVSMFDDFDRFMKVPDEWAPPETKPYAAGENLQHWLTDAKARDQFVIRAGSDTEVLWNDARHLKPDPVYKRTFWTESFVQWSPLGTYLATVHRQGAAVWGGAKPLIVSCDMLILSHEPSNPRDANGCDKYIDVRTGKVMRDFKGSADDFAIGGAGGVSGASWPVFKWSGGRRDKYFARMGKNILSVYETETFSLVDKKSLKVENIMDFSWSPTDPIIALFVPEMGGGKSDSNPQQRGTQTEEPFSVSDCKMYWQSNGDYLAVNVDRYTKTKKSTYTGFELFRIKERDIPIEVLELENKNDKIIAFAWEPKGHRFAVIHGDNPKPDVSIYSMRTAQNTGRFIVLAGLKGFNGQLEFYNVDELETMATAEHFMATDIEWDPTGRYVATAVTSVHEMENGFNIWSFNGKHLYRILKDHFFQFLWRPRPPSFLTPEKEEEIAKNLKKYSKKYEAEDQDAKLRDGEASDEEEEYEAKDIEVEEVIDVTEEVLHFEYGQE